ncbi:hypothetical protein M5K25_009211 [Dendrobium thyrsiflorum]|uniref:Aspartate/glutamate/uridylate kinase domain-containing protein n=1 Tax=Dendrobium thyrsiflorum TaxID=117978 RepID=A0ABD0V5A3_DENTH
MAILFQMGVQACVTGFGRDCQTSIGSLLKQQYAPGVEHVVKWQNTDCSAEQLSIVMKFGGSSVATAERMRGIANLILSCPDEKPVIVLSAMGKTTNKLLQAGEKAASCGVSDVSGIDELRFIKDLHLKTVNELGIDKAVISGQLY